MDFKEQDLPMTAITALFLSLRKKGLVELDDFLEQLALASLAHNGSQENVKANELVEYIAALKMIFDKPSAKDIN